MTFDSISNPTERRYATTYYDFVTGNSGQLPDESTISALTNARLILLRHLVRAQLFTPATHGPPQHNGLYVLGGPYDNAPPISLRPTLALTIADDADSADEESATGD